MDFITSALLSGFIYDMFKLRISLTADNIKKKLQGWVVDDSIAKRLEAELSKLQLSDEMSESAISKKLDSSNEVLALLKEIKSTTQRTVIQTHTGSGDNVGGDKVINH